MRILKLPMAGLVAGLLCAAHDGLTAQQVKWYPEMFHEVLHDPQCEQVFADILTFLAGHGLG